MVMFWPDMSDMVVPDVAASLGGYGMTPDHFDSVFSVKSAVDPDVVGKAAVVARYGLVGSAVVCWVDGCFAAVGCCAVGPIDSEECVTGSD